MILIAVIVVVGLGAGYAVSPYFTESTISEPSPVALPVGDADSVILDDAGAPMITHAGMFVGVGDGIHDAGGDAYVIQLDDDSDTQSSVLRLENFYSTNGPGLRVYLATDVGASDYQSLGDLKANRGDQNYEIPAGVDLKKYNHVLIWCEPFSVLFGSAELAEK